MPCLFDSVVCVLSVPVAARHTTWARSKNADWDSLVSNRAEVTINLVYHKLKSSNIGPVTAGAVLDISKSYERAAYRTNGYAPASLGQFCDRQHRQALL